jgi:hypothetical protein
MECIKKGQNQRFALQELLRNSRWLPSTLQAFSYTLKKRIYLYRHAFFKNAAIKVKKFIQPCDRPDCT